MTTGVLLPAIAPEPSAPARIVIKVAATAIALALFNLWLIIQSN